jgi:hypothetical protein
MSDEQKKEKPLFLTDEQLVELTGKRRPSAQAAELNRQGIQHKVRADGSVLVLRELVDQQFGLRPPRKEVRKSVEPNWDALREMEARRKPPYGAAAASAEAKRKRLEREAKKAAEK